MVNLSFYARDEDAGRARKGRHRRGRNSQVNGPVFGLSSGEPMGTEEAGSNAYLSGQRTEAH